MLGQATRQHHDCPAIPVRLRDLRETVAQIEPNVAHAEAGDDVHSRCPAERGMRREGLNKPGAHTFRPILRCNIHVEVRRVSCGQRGEVTEVAEIRLKVVPGGVAERADQIADNRRSIGHSQKSFVGIVT